MSYQSMDIANLIVSLGIQSEHYLTNLKLQKVLYFLNASFLVEKDKPLLDESFSRWTYGPVVESVYSEFKSYGSSPITKTKPTIKTNGKPFDYEVIPFDIQEVGISKDDLDAIKDNFEKLNTFDPFDLVDKTHRESLWHKYEDAIMTYSAPKYTNAEIKQYFSDNTAEQIWKE